MKGIIRMKYILKRISLIFAIIFVLSFVSFSAFAAVNLDGIVSTREWQNAESTTLYSNTAQSANKISYAEAKIMTIDSNTIFLALSATNTVDEFLDDCGVKITIPKVGSYFFGVDNTSDFENNNHLNIEYGTTATVDGLFFFEFKLTFKKAIPADLKIGIQVTDSSDVLSKQVILSGFADIEATETQANTQTQKHTEAVLNNNTPEVLTNPEKTTKVKTTRPSKTTKFSDSKKTTKFSADSNYMNDKSEYSADYSDSDNNETSETKQGETTEFIAKIDNKNTGSSKTMKVVLTVAAVLLIVLACSVLLFSKVSAKKEDDNNDKEVKNKE